MKREERWEKKRRSIRQKQSYGIKWEEDIKNKKTEMIKNKLILLYEYVK